MIAITKELADSLRKNCTIDWQKRESARANMRMMIKRLLKRHRYPPEGMEDAVQIVMTQCELWADSEIISTEDYLVKPRKQVQYEIPEETPLMVADKGADYNK